MKNFKGLTKNELVNLLAKKQVEIVKNEMESKNQKWNFGKGFQTKNTIKNTWIKLYNTYPIFSKVTPMFSLSNIYNEIIKN